MGLEHLGHHPHRRHRLGHVHARRSVPPVRVSSGELRLHPTSLPPRASRAEERIRDAQAAVPERRARAVAATSTGRLHEGRACRRHSRGRGWRIRHYDLSLGLGAELPAAAGAQEAECAVCRNGRGEGCRDGRHGGKGGRRIQRRPNEQRAAIRLPAATDARPADHAGAGADGGLAPPVLVLITTPAEFQGPDGEKSRRDDGV